MMRSMFSGVSGLRAHQSRMDVIGSNIANVNTTGYKASRASFSDVFNQTLRAASAPGPTWGGTNPIQVGLGATLASVESVLTQGSLQFTGRNTDLAIQGDGYFILGVGNSEYYTRAGNFGRDALGYLVNPVNGWRVKGWMADTAGNIPVKDWNTLESIRFPNGDAMLATSTSTLRLGQSLDALAAVGTEYTTAVSVYDSLGAEETIVLKFKKTAASTWDWAAFAADGTTLLTSTATGTVDGAAGATFASGGSYAGGGQIQFNADGSIKRTAATTPVYGSFQFTPASGGAAQTVNLDFAKVSQPALVGLATSTLRVEERDGNPMGELTDFAVDANGVIFGLYSNGVRRTMAQVALAVFPNAEGLTRAGQNAFAESNNSGLRQVGEAGTGGRGTMAPSNLEMSNVDLSTQFTDMIVTQHGFQANSRIITASDEMLRELVNLRR